MTTTIWTFTLATPAAAARLMYIAARYLMRRSTGEALTDAAMIFGLCLVFSASLAVGAAH
jgi:hypothetical protein